MNVANIALQTDKYYIQTMMYDDACLINLVPQTYSCGIGTICSSFIFLHFHILPNLVLSINAQILYTPTLYFTFVYTDTLKQNKMISHY